MLERSATRVSNFIINFYQEYEISSCLVFLAAFIGLYFVIEIQAKSKITEGKFFAFNLTSSSLQRPIRVRKVRKTPPTSREWLNCCAMSAMRLICGYLPQLHAKISEYRILGGKFGQ